MRASPFRIGLAAGGLIVLVSACTQSLTDLPKARLARYGGHTASLLRIPNVTLCKYGSAATFNVSVNGGTPATWNLNDGDCFPVFMYSGSSADVAITEAPLAGFTLDSITKDSTYFDTVAFQWTTVHLGPFSVGRTIHVFVDSVTLGAVLFYNRAFTPTPGLSLVKTASTTTPVSGAPVTYSYLVTNTGNVALSNIVVKDDNGTPLYTGDDFTVGTVASLAPGASVTLTATTIPSQTSIAASLGGAGPTSFAVFSLGGDAAHLNAGINCSAATVNGDVAVAGYGVFKNAAPCIEYGDLFRGSHVAVSGPGKLMGSIFTDDNLLNTARADAFASAAWLAGLPATPAAQAQFPANGSISGNVTITGTPGLNVIQLPGLLLNGNLTLSGPPGTQFVLDVHGNYNLHSGNITVAGGMSPWDVVYNITDPSASVQTMVPTTAVGVLLAPNNTINAMDSQNFAGEIVGGYNKVITLMSGTRVQPPTPPPPTVTNTATAATAYAGNGLTATATASVTIQ